MNKVFNFEGPFFTFFSRLADLCWLNILFILCCIPVVTAGAAITGLYYVTLKMAKDEEGYITKSFFKSFKENFLQATGIWIGFLVIFTVMYVDLMIAGDGTAAGMFGFSHVSDVIIVTVGIMALLIFMTLTYVFPVLAQFDNTVKNTVKNAFLISIRHLPYTFVMMIITVIPFALIWFFPALTIIVMIMFSLTAYINSKFFNRIFVNYMPQEGINGENGQE